MHISSINKIIIVGGGTAGWMAAASLANYHRHDDVKITLIESPEIGTIGVGEATIPGIRDFNSSLGIDEIDFIQQTQATFKLGIKFINWKKLGHAFFHPFGRYGVDLNGISFHHYIAKLRQEGHRFELADFSLSTKMADANKFAQPNINPPSPLADYKYAFHFDAQLYAKYLRRYAEKLGVNRIEGTVTATRLRQHDGFVESVITSDSQQFSADLFIDCSGFKGLIIEEGLHAGYEDWSHWLPCDKAIALQSELLTPPSPYTQATAQTAGWRWQIPLQHRMGNGLVYCSQYLSDENALAELQGSLQGKSVTQPRLLRFVCGRRKKFWIKNCVALGLAAGFLEPLESTSISLIQTGLSKLFLFYPDKEFNQPEIDEANRLAQLESERIRDFLILHYQASQRDDTEFWRYCKNMTIPDTLRQKIALFKRRGHLINYQEESFQDASWVTMYNGFGIEQQSFDRRADGLDSPSLLNNLQQMQQAILKAAKHAPTHEEFIDRHCRASK